MKRCTWGSRRNEAFREKTRRNRTETGCETPRQRRSQMSPKRGTYKPRRVVGLPTAGEAAALNRPRPPPSPGCRLSGSGRPTLPGRRSSGHRTSRRRCDWISGFFVDMLYRSRFHSWSRRAPATVGFLLATSGIYAVPLVNYPGAAVAAFALAMFGIELTISPSWAYCIDIGRKNSGSVSAAMNMAGSFGALASANAFPWLHRLTGDSGTYFRIAAGLNALAILFWLTMRSNHSLKNVSTSENILADPAPGT